MILDHRGQPIPETPRLGFCPSAPTPARRPYVAKGDATGAGDAPADAVGSWTFEADTFETDEDETE